MQYLHPLQGISFIIIKGEYLSFILESVNVISLSNIPFLLISIAPGSCFVLTNNMKEAIPYEGAKSMYLVSDVDNSEILKSIVLDTCEGIKVNKK